MAFLIGIMLFLLCIVASRWLVERAFRRLDVAQKLKLMNAFSGSRAFGMLPLLLIVGVMVGLPLAVPTVASIQEWALGLGLALLLVYVVAMHFWVRSKLAALNLPADFTRKFLFARHVSHLGCAAIFVVMLLAL